MFSEILRFTLAIVVLFGAGVFSYTYLENKVGPQPSAPVVTQTVPKDVLKITTTAKVTTSTTAKAPAKVSVVVPPKTKVSIVPSKIVVEKIVVEQTVVAPGPLRVALPATIAPSNALTIRGVIEYTNIARAQNGGFSALTENSILNLNAQMKLQDMFTMQYFDHVSPYSDVGPGDLAKTVGYAYVIVGENLALGDFVNDEKLVDAWMASPGHRANILNRFYLEIGVAVGKGIYEGRNTWLAVQSFGMPLSACPSIDMQMKAQIDSNNTQITILKAELDAKKAQIDSTPADDPNYNTYVGEFNTLIRPYNALVESNKALILIYNAQIQAYNDCVNSVVAI